MKYKLKQLLSWVLMITMIAPNMAPMIAYGAEYLNNRPRYVDFVRPEALTIQELGLASDSNSAVITAPKKTESERENNTATFSNAALREPEAFYDDTTVEPDGMLVQFDEERNIRTYQQGEGEYITVVGGYSGLYRDNDKIIRTVDNQMVNTRKSDEPEDDEEEEFQDMELINDLGNHLGITATPSNAKRIRTVETATASDAYYNRAGKLDVYLPEKMNSRKGYCITKGDDMIEIIPQEGNYFQSAASENAVRYSNVFDGIDVQYTVIGDTVKEDIILLEKQDRNRFSYQLKSSTLKFKKDGDAVLAYKDSYRKPTFALTAPVMIDAEGNTSTKIKLAYNSVSKIVTYTADHEWLNAPEREYPVRIDPTGATLVDYTAFQVNMVAKGGKHLGTPNVHGKYFGSNINPMVGFSEDYGYCRALIHIDAAWEQLMGRPDETEGPDVDNVQLSMSVMTKDAVNKTAFQTFIPSNSWNPANVTWDRMKQDGVDRNMQKTGEIQYSSGEAKDRLVFDITELYYKWLDGSAPRNGLLLQAYVEAGDEDYIPGVSDKGSVSWAETFYNQNGGSAFGPRLEVAWRGELEHTDLLTMDMDKFSVRVDPGVVESEAGGRNTKGILVHGASQAYSTVDYRLKKKDGQLVLDGSTEAHDKVDCPDYLEVDDECILATYQDSNWQSEPILTLDPLEMDTIYYMEAMGTGFNVEEDEEGNPQLGEEEVTTKWLPTDEFLLYLVQASDILPRIARHYGISTNTLMEDNQMGFQLAEAGDAVFIRTPQTDEPYTTPLTPEQMEEFIKNCLLNGYDPRCEMGGEPINLSTGSFYMSQTDASFDDLDGEFSITRSYNGLTPYFRSEFGMGWNSLIGERIMVLKDGSILYTRDDGKGMVFTKDGEHTFRAPEGYDYELKAVDTIDLVTGSGDMDQETDGADTVDENVEKAATERKLFSAEEGEDQVEPVAPATGWEITQPDGTVKVFNSYGLLVTERNRKEHKTSYVYDDDYLLTEILAPSGKSYGITMESDGKITEITLPDGGSLIYEYDEKDNLISVTNPEGDMRRYVYDENHRMISWYDENGTKIIENVLDEKGRVIEQTDALGSVMYFAYSEGQTVLTDNNGNRTIYQLDDQRRNVGITYANGDTSRTVYSDDNRIASNIDERGAVTRYTYDDNGNILTETRDDGSSASYTYNELNLPITATDYEGNTTRYTYDEVGNLLSMKDGEGNTFRYSYDEINRLESITDANGGVTTFVYDGAVVVSMTDGEGHNSSFAYDEMNRVLVETDPLGHTTEHSYNGNGWETTTTNKDGGVTTYAFSPAGEVLVITDPMGVTTDFTYDKMYNILSGEDALGNTLTYEYDANYNKISETDAKGNMTTYTYDSRNRLTKITDALGQEIKYTLDELGNMTESTDRRGNTSTAWYHKTLNLPTMMGDKLGHETYYTYDGNGNVLKIAYPDGSKQTYAYDRAGRVIRTTAQNGLVTEMSYDGNGNITKITDDETRVYTFAYDHNNRLVTTTDPLGGVAEYVYDAAGNQTEVTDAEAHSTGYTYDAAGRLKEVQDALEGTASMDYDLNGLTTQTTDQNGHATTYHYDVIGQLLAQVDAQGYVTAMEYDSLGNVTKTTDALKGEVTSVYDALNRTTKLTDPMGNEYLYEYDAEGNLIKVTAPDGDTISMTYDANGQMTTSTDEAGVINTYTYDSMGRVTLAKDNIGNQMSYEYNEAGNLVKQTDTIGRDAIYTYDKFNRPETVTGTDGATTTYGYDALDRLISVTLADLTVTTYEYDKVGNLIKTTEPGEATYTYAYDAINRLSEKVDPLGAVTQFRYDAKGNLTGTTDAEAAENSYLYDAIDRLTSFTDGRGNATQYEYDELSRLLSHTTPEGNKQEYRYDANGSMTRAKDANGLITEYRYDVMGNLMEAISPKGAKTGYTYDKHDEVTSIQDPAGNLVNYEVDLNRRVTKITEKNGGQYTYSYDQVHRMTNISTPLGLTRTMTYDTADNVVKDTDSLGRGSSYSYDIMHRMLKAVDSKGGITNFDYDIRGNQNKLTDALGYTWNYNYDLIDQLTASVDPEGKATEVAYNLVGKVNSITKPGERTTAYEYDGNYNVTGVIDPKGYKYGFTYDKDNRQIGTIDPLSQTTSTTYDAGSRVTSLKDKMGLTQSFEYDPHGNVLTSKATNGLITRFSYDILDNLLQVTMPSGLTTHYSYDVMSNVTSMTDTMKRVTQYTYDLEGNMTSLTDISGRTEQMTYDAGGRITSYTSNGGNKINYDYDTLNSLVEKSYEDTRDSESKEGVLYGYDALGQRLSMMDRSGESTYEYDGLGRITKVTTGSGEVTTYAYDGSDQLESITYPDGKKVSYKYDKNDNLTEVTDRTGAKTTYIYDAINRITQIHRPNGVSTYNTYNARDQIVSMKNLCDDCDWVVSQYDYIYDDRGFITGEDAIESLYGYAWDDKHDGKHENWHDTLYPHGDKHYNKHDKDGLYGFQIIETKRSFEYDDDGKLLSATENEDRQGRYDYTFQYDDMGNRTFYSKSRNGKVQESVEYTYNSANQPIKAKQYDGKHYKTVEYSYDLDGNRILEEEIKPDGTRKVEKVYEYTVENRLKAVSDKEDLLTAMAYDGDGNRIFQLNYNLHTDDDWKGNSGNGNGNNKDNAGSGNSGNTSGNGTGSKTKAATVTGEEATETEPSFWDKIVSFFTGDKAEETETATSSNAHKNDKPNGNNANGNGNKPEKPNKPDKPNKPNDNTSTGGVNDNNGNANGNTNNTGGSQNQSGILFPIDGEVSELESELIGMIKTTGKEKNYELVEYVNDVNREHTEVLMELNINGIMDTAYSYGDQRLTNERFTKWTGYYTYDPRGSVTGVTDDKGMIWQSYRYDVFGDFTFGKPQYNNVYSYNAESYNPNMDTQYLRARYYSVGTANFLTEDSYLGDITDPLTLNRYNYTKSSPLNYMDPSGHMATERLNMFLDLYLSGQITDEDLGKVVISRNLNNLFLAFHELAQIHAAAQLYKKYGFGNEYGKSNIKLEEPVKNASTITGKHVQGCYEVDIFASIIPFGKPMAWEVKAITYMPDSWMNRDAHEKFATMLNIASPEMYRGDNAMIDTMMGIPVIGPIMMGIVAPDNDPGFVYYVLYVQDVDRETGEIVNIQISLNEAKDYINKRDENSQEILEFVAFAGVHGLLNWGFTSGVEKEIAQNGTSIIDYYDHLKKTLDKVS